MIKYQNINLAVVETELGYVVMTKNYLPVSIGEANDLISKIFKSNEYFIDDTLNHGFNNQYEKITIEPFSSEEVLDNDLIGSLKLITQEVLSNNPSWLNNGNLTTEEKNRFIKTKMI